jgi:hypothetical protein
VPRHERQVAEQDAEDLGVPRAGQQRHQQDGAQHRRHRHRPPRGALDLPPRPHARRDLPDHIRLPCHLIELLLDDPQPHVIRRVPAGLHPAIPADQRRGDRDGLAEHHHLPGADRRPARRRQGGPVPFRGRAPQRGPQVRHPDRDHPRPGQLRRPPALPGGGTGRNRHGKVERHEGLRG